MKTTITGLAVGVAAALLGLAPWLATGARLPLQTMWDSDTLPADMPFAPLPVSQYFVVELVALLLIGGALAGVAVLLLEPWMRGARWPVAAGLGIVHVGAVVESFTVLVRGVGLLEPGGFSIGTAIYVTAMLFGVTVVAAASQAVCWLAGSPRPWAAALGLGLAAAPFGEWMGLWYMLGAGPSGGGIVSHELVRWLPALAAGAVLGWLGVRPAARLGVWGGVLVVLWFLPAALSSLLSALGTRGVFGDLPEMLRMIGEWFLPRLAEALSPAVGAALLGLAIVGVRELVAAVGAAARVPDVQAPVAPSVR